MNDNTSDADKYRIMQAQKIFDLFEEANGKPPANSDEITDWAKSPDGREVIGRHLDERGKIIP